MFACLPLRMHLRSSSSSPPQMFALRYNCLGTDSLFAPRGPPLSSPTSSPPSTLSMLDVKGGILLKSPLTSTIVAAPSPKSVTPSPPTPPPVSAVSSSNGRTTLNRSNGPTNSSDRAGNGRHNPSQSPILHSFSFVTYAQSSTSALHLPLSYIARNDAAR